MTAFDLPDAPKIKATNFRLDRVQAMNPLRGGHHQAVDMGEPVWMCDISTTPLSRAQGGAWKALFAKLRGALRTLFLYDASRPRPLAYHDTGDVEWYASSEDIYASGIDASAGGFTAAWGAGVIVEIDRTTSRIKLIDMTAAASLSLGDYLAWDDGPTRRLHIVVEPAAVASDGTVWLTIEPAPPEASNYLPAPATMQRAAAEMVILEAQAPYSAPATHEVTLQAGQVLRRS